VVLGETPLRFDWFLIPELSALGLPVRGIDRLRPARTDAFGDQAAKQVGRRTFLIVSLRHGLSRRARERRVGQALEAREFRQEHGVDRLQRPLRCLPMMNLGAAAVGAVLVVRPRRGR